MASGQRLELHELLVGVLGSRNVYFQPPASLQMQYPCILYRRNDMDIKRANDRVYSHTTGYMVTVIDANPDSEIPEKLLDFPMCRFDRHYTSENLNHDTYILYY